MKMIQFLVEAYGDLVPVPPTGNHRVLMTADAAESLVRNLQTAIQTVRTQPVFKQYRRKSIAEMRPWNPGDDMTGVSVSAEDTKAGSPKMGDMIARNPANHADQWLVAAAYFEDNFEAL